MRLNSNKIVVFDLDETLGCFVELGMFWDALEHIYEKNLTQDDFFKVMNTFPEFIRPNIFKILNFCFNSLYNLYIHNHFINNWATLHL